MKRIIVYERWIYVLKNMETLNRLPFAAQNSVFQRLAEIGEVSALTKEERIEYDHALKKYRDTLNALAGAEQKGWEKGREEERLLNAKNLKENGVPLNLIAKSLGLTDAELQQL